MLQIRNILPTQAPHELSHGLSAWLYALFLNVDLAIRLM